MVAGLGRQEPLRDSAFHTGTASTQLGFRASGLAELRGEERRCPVGRKH